jgi:hypothetical protein
VRSLCSSTKTRSFSSSSRKTCLKYASSHKRDLAPAPFGKQYFFSSLLNIDNVEETEALVNPFNKGRLVNIKNVFEAIVDAFAFLNHPGKKLQHNHFETP